MSTTKKKGLGRGLTALFGDQKENVKKEDKISNKGLKASIGDLSPNKYQPRIHFDEEKLKELANSIKKNGIIQSYQQPVLIVNQPVDSWLTLIRIPMKLESLKGTLIILEVEVVIAQKVLRQLTRSMILREFYTQ